MAKPLTVKTIDAAKAVDSRLELPDGGTSGLFLVVQPSGAKSWAFRYRSPIAQNAKGHSAPRKMTIGTYPAIGLADAREAAGVALRNVKRGIDPIEAAKEAKLKEADKSDLVDAQLDDFIARHVEAKNRASTATEAKRVFDKVVRPAWGKRKVHSITRRDVVALLDGVVDRGAPIAANRLLAVIRKFFNWLVERSVLEASPVTGLKAPAMESSRDRVLSDDELRWLWKSTDSNAPFDQAIRLLVLTAQRRNEVGGIARSELDLEAAEPAWILPGVRTKNGRPNLVPLSYLAVAAIETVPKVGRSRLVFTTTGKTPISGWSHSKIALDARMVKAAREEASEAGEDPSVVNIPAWRLHDLRRTAASGMARLGQPVHVVEAVLNHSSGAVSGVAAIYNRHEYQDEKRKALTAWSAHVAYLVSDATKSNVVPLRAAK